MTAATATLREELTRAPEHVSRAGRFKAALAAASAATDLVWAIASEEKLPDSGCCENPELKVITTGLEQWCDYDPEKNQAHTDGWDDMGDMDGPEYLLCLSCDGVFAKPEGLDWD